MNSSDQRLPRSAVILIVTRGFSSIGTTLTAFGLDVWVFRQTGSYATFALLAVLANLPVLLFAPFAGVMTDRFDKKKLLIAADIISGVAVLVTLILYLAGALAVPAVAAAILLLAIAGELRWSSMSALFSTIVPKERLGRVNALQQAFRGANVMLGPLLGALGLDLLGLPALLCADVLSYVISLVAFLVIQVDGRPHPRSEDESAPSFVDELTFGFRWVWRQPGLRRLLVFFMVVNIGVSVFTVSIPPYLLSFSSNTVLAVGLGLVGAGAFLSGLYLGKRSGAEQMPETGILWGTLAFGLGVTLWGIFRQPVVLFAIAFCIGVLETVIMSSTQTAWQTYVPKGIQGKVFAVRTVVSFGMAPLAILGSVPLATHTFQPLVADAGSAAVAVWGTAQTGALGMMVSIFGIGVLVCAAVLLFGGGLRLSDGQAGATVPGGATNQ